MHLLLLRQTQYRLLIGGNLEKIKAAILASAKSSDMVADDEAGRKFDMEGAGVTGVTLTDVKVTASFLYNTNLRSC